MNRTLLLVDDEESILHSLVRQLRNEGYTLLTANGGEAALRLLASNDVQVILSDQRMPGMTGAELLEQAKDLYPDSVRMVLSGYSDLTAITDAVNKGSIYKFLFKPWDNDLLLASVRDAFERFELSQKRVQFSRIYENSVEGIVITDQDARIQAVNPAFSAITGYAPEEVIGKNPALLKSGSHDAAFYRAMWSNLHEHGKWSGEVWNRRKSGERYPEWLSIIAIRDTRGTVFQYVGLFSDITEHKRNEERLRCQAYHDALTDLPNRLLLSENLALAIEEAKRSSQQVAVLLVDLSITSSQDNLGRDLDEQLLVAVTGRLKSVVRMGDILARMGRYEFTLLLPQVDDGKDLAHAVEKVIAEFAQPFELGGHQLNVTTSIGVSLYPQDGDSPEALLKNAASALHQAREAGSNSYRFFAPP